MCNFGILRSLTRNCTKLRNCVAIILTYPRKKNLRYLQISIFQKHYDILLIFLKTRLLYLDCIRHFQAQPHKAKFFEGS